MLMEFCTIRAKYFKTTNNTKTFFMFKIAIDLMGGDYNSREPIKGIEHFVKSNPKKVYFFTLLEKKKIF